MFSHPVLNEGEHVTGVVEYLIDISEHVMAKRQVAQSDANWRALTENSPDRILLVGVDGRILFANFRLEEGSENPATGENLYRFLQDAERQRVRDCFSRVLASGHAECYESEYVGGDGQSRFFASTVAPVRRDDRNVALVVNSRDITELRRSLLELRESERFLRSTLNGLLSQIAIVDESGEIVSVNNAWRRFAEANGVAANRVSEGCNYLSVCDRATGEGASDARVVAAEVRLVAAWRQALAGLRIWLSQSGQTTLVRLAGDPLSWRRPAASSDRARGHHSTQAGRGESQEAGPLLADAD